MEEPGSAHLRVARLSRDLAVAEHFWCAGLGLQVLWRIDPTGPGEHRLLMLGKPNAGWHLELVEQLLAPSGIASTSDQDQLVLYLHKAVNDELAQRIEAAGGQVVPASNPYWARWGITVRDPDGYRLVLCTRAWSS